MKTGSPGQYEGYTVDVLDALAETNNFTYSITPEQDGVYGVKDDKGNWNGMMGQLVSKVRTVSVYNTWNSPDFYSVWENMSEKMLLHVQIEHSLQLPCQFSIHVKVWWSVFGT